jgi:hypothetical protein
MICSILKSKCWLILLADKKKLMKLILAFEIKIKVKIKIKIKIKIKL